MRQPLRLWITFLILGLAPEAEAALGLRGSVFGVTGGTVNSESFFGVLTAGAPISGTANSESFQLGPAESVPVGEAVATPDRTTTGIHLALNVVSNPFRRSTRFRIAVTEAGTARMQVFGLTGTLVATLFDGFVPAGVHDVTWDGRDSRGNPAAVGMYFVRLSTGQGVATLSLLKVG